MHTMQHRKVCRRFDCHCHWRQHPARAVLPRPMPAGRNSGKHVVLWAVLFAGASHTSVDAFISSSLRPLALGTPAHLAALSPHGAARAKHAVPAAAASSAASSSAAAAGQQARVEAQMAWLAAHGVVLDGVTLEVSPLQGLGVVATRDLGVGDAAILVPRAAQLFAESEALHPTSRCLAEKAAARLGASSSPSVAAKFEEGALAAALVSEASLLRGGAGTREPGGAESENDGALSHFAAYLESLPRLSEMSGPAWLWEDERLEREASALLDVHACMHACVHMNT